MRKQKTIYLIGYLGRTAEELRAIVGKGTLLDIRISPNSRKAGLSRKALEEAYGNRYQWIYELGNEAYNTDEPVKLYDPVPGLEIVQAIHKRTRHPIYLMCACRDGDKCHRKEVGRLLVEMGYTVEEYQDDKGNQQ